MGIFALRYTMTTLSDLGFHDIALSKAAAVEIPSFDYMLSHNATTLWETWWRSEDVYSRYVWPQLIVAAASDTLSKKSSYARCDR